MLDNYWIKSLNLVHKHELRGRSMEFDYLKLRKLIKGKYGTQKEFAKKLGIGRVSLNQRLNNISEFTQDEMFDACELLDIKAEEIPIYFFNIKVQKKEHS